MLQVGTEYMLLAALIVGALACLLGVFTLVTRKIPRWVPSSRARQAQWKPYGWAQIFTFAWMTTMFLPRMLDVDPLLGLGLMVPAICFMVTSWFFLFRAISPMKGGESRGGGG
ncbi:hypothetical protein [Nonomuraea sp. NPDC049695]|uniref:hypothetical protein n=1 Tax=Nonomuraea sp. NPDC049695 TaxID=3154734 RepID=UPI003436DAC0